MAGLTIYKDNYVDSTIVSNSFIDYYMKDANDAQLKIYLYLLRMINAQLTISISDIADQFNHTEKDVLRALKYWENKKLLSLDYDQNKNLVGLHLLDISNESVEAPTQNILSLYKETPKETTVEDTTTYKKPNITAEQLRNFKERESTAQLLFIAETYVSKPLTPTDIKTIIFMSDTLGFSDDLIDYLIQYCVERGKKEFRYMEKVAISWAGDGITTPKQAQKIINKYDKSVYTIMNSLGKNSSPTTKELEFINRWTRDYAFTNDIIIEACERTVLATDTHRFEYAEGILNRWYQANIHHKADIKKADESFQKQRNMAKTPTVTNKFNQFKQNNYDFDELEKELLSN